MQSNLFTVNLATRLGFELLKKKAGGWVAKYILGGPLGFIFMFFAKKYMNMLVHEGILLIDLGLIARRVSEEKIEYKKFIEEAYHRAKVKIYEEEEKQKIREEYLDALSSFAILDNRVRDK